MIIIFVAAAALVVFESIWMVLEVQKYITFWCLLKKNKNIFLKIWF